MQTLTCMCVENSSLSVNKFEGDISTKKPTQFLNLFSEAQGFTKELLKRKVELASLTKQAMILQRENSSLTMIISIPLITSCGETMHRLLVKIIG